MTQTYIRNGKRRKCCVILRFFTGKFLNPKLQKLREGCGRSSICTKCDWNDRFREGGSGVEGVGGRKKELDPEKIHSWGAEGKKKTSKPNGVRRTSNEGKGAGILSLHPWRESNGRLARTVSTSHEESTIMLQTRLRGVWADWKRHTA